MVESNTQIVALLNEAGLADGTRKLQCLRDVQELLINKDPVLLDNMLVRIMKVHPKKPNFTIESLFWVFGFLLLSEFYFSTVSKRLQLNCSSSSRANKLFQNF